MNNKKIGEISYPKENFCINEYHSNTSFYKFSSNSIYQFEILNLHPFKYKFAKKTIPGIIKWYKFSNSKLLITCTNGTVLVYDTKSLQLLTTINNKFNVNTAYCDKLGNIWTATLNNGLMYYTNSSIKKESYSNDAVTNFLCAKINDNGSLYAGNYQGEIFKKDAKKEIKYNFSQTKKNNLWVRNINFFKDTVVTVTDNGLNINFKKVITLVDKNNLDINIKSSDKLNDNIIILGSVTGLVKFNISSQKYEEIPFFKQRVLNVKTCNSSSFYFLANDGVYLYDLNQKKFKLIISNTILKNDKTKNFEKTDNNSIWVNTYKGNLYLISNNKIIKKFINDERLPINSSNLLNIKNKLWIASKSGLYILDYKDLQKCEITKLTTADGLTSNALNFLDFKKDTIYAASDNGVSKIPLNSLRSRKKINPEVISIKINNAFVALKPNYELKNNENNISLELAGVDITGHFKFFLYSINQSKYFSINGNFLNIKLNDGLNEIKIKAVDQDNVLQPNYIKLKFDVAIPLYKTIWFWVMVSFFLTALFFYLINQRKLQKQKREFEQQFQLEQQRTQIIADLHDDIGATLSSLQLNSAVANQLLKKDTNKTEILLEKIENQSKDLADKIGDIIWSMKSQEHEFMNLSTRIKNFANDILSAVNCDYSIQIDEEINSLITNITIRKNLILISKEAINNCAKYSNAKKIIISITIQNAIIELMIKDNGVGFDPLKIKGNGISNIRKRASEINAAITIDSTINQGTAIVLKIPYP